MRRHLLQWGLSTALLLQPFIASAQSPLISPKGIVNAATFGPPLLPGGAIGQGSIFSIFGSNIGPATGVSAPAFPLQTALSGVSVKVIQGQTSVDAYPLYVSSTLINAIMPSNAPTGTVSVQVTVNGTKSNMGPVKVAVNAPGIFTATGAGVGPGILQNVITGTNVPVNSARIAAQPGETMVLWLTGLGPATFPDNVAPTATDLPYKVEIWVGGQLVQGTAYSGRTPCCAGVDEIVFNLPANTPPGCFVPVMLRVNGSAVSNAVTIAVGPDARSCSDQLNPLQTGYTQGGNEGVVTLIRRLIHLSSTDPSSTATPTDITLDQAGAEFKKEAGADFSFNVSYATPPPGSCTVYAGKGDFTEAAAPFFTDSISLDAGKLTVTGASSTLALSQFSGRDVKTYATMFGSTGLLPANLTQQPLFLNPGTFTVNGAGGTDVGPFSANLTIASGVNWTNRDQLTTVDRTKGFTATWTGSAAAVGVVGVNVDVPYNSSSAFVCAAPVGATSFTVPSWILTNFPATRTSGGESRSLIGVVSASAPVSFNATGLDRGSLFYLQMAIRNVTFQ